MTDRYQIFALSVAVFFASPGFCNEVDFGTRTPSVGQVIDALKGGDYSAESDLENNQFEVAIGRRRGINFIPVAGKEPKVVVRNLPPAPGNAAHVDEHALSIELYFDYNSAELKPDTMSKLRPVGKALASQELDSLRFIVEGHTDSIGSDEYNYNLSKRRARSVKDFLVAEYHLDPSRLNVIGRGEKVLIDPSHPASEVNRRVRIIAK